MYTLCFKAREGNAVLYVPNIKKRDIGHEIWRKRNEWSITGFILNKKGNK